ncbi:MAG: fibrobacter succinogenes major paralogous domain-containing protein [Bacteroidetes bacterium]|nr:fibrobacter succinogenes major paralogous domain-containing protein [Bacteroidota bacterium]
MTKKNIFWFSPFVVMGIVLLFATGCKKSNSTTSPAPAGGTVTDIDGNVYHTVTIGTQVWLVENLQVTHYRNGDPIIAGSLKADGKLLTDTTGKVYAYNNSSENAKVYGRLYNWYALGSAHTIAPNGCHVPSDAEWYALSAYLSTKYGTATIPDYGGIGSVLKEAGTTHWQTPNTGATNESGFTALPGGSFAYGVFGGLGAQCFFWTSTQVGTGTNQPAAWSVNLAFDGIIAHRVNPIKQYGISVRCLKD